MVQFLKLPFWVEEEAPPLQSLLTEAQAAALPQDPQLRPQTFRQPSPQAFRRHRARLRELLHLARQANQQGSRAELGKLYGQLVVEFTPAIRWAVDCWEYLLSVEGCRFLPRTADEKQYCRGDYRVFTERDFIRFAHQSFKESFRHYLLQATPGPFETYLRKHYWETVQTRYQALENPPDGRQRRLTGYSYLRCVPYQFLNRVHQERVDQQVNRLPTQEREAIELYFLSFFREEAVLEVTQISQLAFRRRRARALRNIARQDTLSAALLLQIERY